MIFGPAYADAYDWLYRDKDYGAECELIQNTVRLYATGTAERLLDLGCGSGNHLLPLARAGWSGVGVDRSEAMLAHARRKAEEMTVSDRVAFVCADIRDFRSPEDFDAALMMFAVLGYQIETDDVLNALRTARAHLRHGGCFIFDIWYGRAVLHQLPSDREKTVKTDEGKVTRFASSTLDAGSHTCRVDFHLEWTRAGQVREYAEERHTVRFFFPKEIELLLDLAGFEFRQLRDFSAPDREPTLATWNALVVAVAR